MIPKTSHSVTDVLFRRSAYSSFVAVSVEGFGEEWLREKRVLYNCTFNHKPNIEKAKRSTPRSAGNVEREKGFK